MDTDLLTAARALARRGWLPGIAIDSADMLCRLGYSDIRCRLNEETMEAHLHLAAHNEIVRRGWVYQVDDGTNVMVQNTEMWCYDQGTTTLSLLRALRAACEAQEKTNGS